MLKEKLQTSRKPYNTDPLRSQKRKKEHMFTINKQLKGILKCHIFAICITVDLLTCMFKQCATLVTEWAARQSEWALWLTGSSFSHINNNS